MTVKNNEQLGAFDKLLGELDTLTKALPAEGDAKIANAEGDDPEGDDPEDGEGESGEAGATMAKSFVVKMADGTEVEAEDGTALVKSLMGRIDGTESTMAKALGSAVDLIKAQGIALASNTAMIKSLQSKVSALSGEGKGRKTVLSVHEKQAGVLTKSQDEGMTQVEFLAKSDSAFANKKISGHEFVMIDVSLRQNHPIDPALIAKVLA